jgi:hypothetical protein
LAELLNALQAQEQRRLMRQASSVEGAFFAKSQNNIQQRNRNYRAGTQHFHHVLIAKNPIIHKADAGGGQI